MQNLSDFIMKCAFFEEHSSSCVVYSRLGGTLFPVSMIDGDHRLFYSSVLYCHQIVYSRQFLWEPSWKEQRIEKFKMAATDKEN